MPYQIDGDFDEQNRMQVNYSSWGQTGDLGVRSKGPISFNFNYKVNFKDFYTKTLCVFSQMKDTKHTGTRRDFHSVAWVMPQGWGVRGAQGVKINFFQTWSCGISNRGDEEQNRMQVKFSS